MVEFNSSISENEIRTSIAAPDDTSSDSDSDDADYSVRRVLDVTGTAPARRFYVEWDGYDS